jgi:hypothetical protein
MSPRRLGQRELAFQHGQHDLDLLVHGHLPGRLLRSAHPDTLRDRSTSDPATKSDALHSSQIEIIFDTLRCISSTGQLLYSALHGIAMRYAAERRSLDESIEELREIADGRNDILAEAAGITAGCWYASPATHVGHELIGAGVLILAGGGQGFPLDMTSLSAGTRVGFERGMRSRKGER